jgi:two-component system response regulator (stage 0 sporulation protein F)
MRQILVAEDNNLIRRALTEALYRENYEVLEVETGKQALQKFEESQPDLIVLDIKMPDIDGIEVLKKIRAVNRQVPIIILTAYKGLEKDPEIALGNVSAFMTKPVDIDVFRAKVNEILKNR